MNGPNCCYLPLPAFLASLCPALPCQPCLACLACRLLDVFQGHAQWLQAQQPTEISGRALSGVNLMLDALRPGSNGAELKHIMTTTHSNHFAEDVMYAARSLLRRYMLSHAPASELPAGWVIAGLDDMRVWVLARSGRIPRCQRLHTSMGGGGGGGAEPTLQTMHPLLLYPGSQPCAALAAALVGSALPSQARVAFHSSLRVCRA